MVTNVHTHTWKFNTHARTIAHKWQSTFSVLMFPISAWWCTYTYIHWGVVRMQEPSLTNGNRHPATRFIQCKSMVTLPWCLGIGGRFSNATIDLHCINLDAASAARCGCTLNWHWQWIHWIQQIVQKLCCNKLGSILKISTLSFNQRDPCGLNSFDFSFLSSNSVNASTTYCVVFWDQVRCISCCDWSREKYLTWLGEWQITKLDSEDYLFVVFEIHQKIVSAKPRYFSTLHFSKHLYTDRVDSGPKWWLGRRASCDLSRGPGSGCGSVAA